MYLHHRQDTDQMNPANYHPNAGMMNNGPAMDPYGQNIPQGYGNAPQMGGGFQPIQMPNQMTYGGMRASGGISQRYNQNAQMQQTNSMLNSMASQANFAGMGQPQMSASQQQMAAAAAVAAAAASSQQMRQQGPPQMGGPNPNNPNVPNLRSLAAQRVQPGQQQVGPQGRMGGGPGQGPQQGPGAGGPPNANAMAAAALVNRLAAAAASAGLPPGAPGVNPQQAGGPGGYSPSGELLAMLASAQNAAAGASLLQNMDAAKLASLDAGLANLSLAAAAAAQQQGSAQGMNPQVALAHLKQQQALLAAQQAAQQQQSSQQSQTSEPILHLPDDDFPSLASGLRTSGTLAVPQSQPGQNPVSGQQTPQQQLLQLQQQQQQLAAAAAAAQQLAAAAAQQQKQQMGAPSSSSASVGQPQQSSSAGVNPLNPPGPQQQTPPAGMAAVAASDPYGLLGLTRVLKMTDKDLNTLALGTDLTTLGLNLSSPDVLYSSFASPWANSPMKRREPEFQIPSCYYINPPLPSPTDKMSLFSDETLFYIFYSMPRDALQISAANELYSREWRYHTELQTWFHRIPGTDPILKTATYERGSYVYFDVSTWNQTLKENFVLEYDKLETLPLKA